MWDADQLRTLVIRGTIKVLGVMEGKECAVLSKFVDQLSPEVKAVSVDDDGLLTAISNDLKDDQTWHLPFLLFLLVKSMLPCSTMKYSELQELDRFGPGVDSTRWVQKKPSRMRGTS